MKRLCPKAYHAWKKIMAPDWSSMESWCRSQQQSIQIECVISKLQIS